MIDFRYHLVSIAAIFLALAVGIVLGAGPLKGTLGDTLASEVAQLRSDADALRADVAAAETEVTERDEVLTTVRPLAAAGILDGSTVSILALPGSADETVEASRAAIVESGGGVGSEVLLAGSWASEDPPDVTDRTTAAAELRELLAGDLPVGIPPERVIALALGWALATDPTAQSSDQASAERPTETAPATPDDGTTETPDDGTTQPSDDPADERGGTEDATSLRILEILEAYGLLTVEGEDAPARTDAVIVVAPAPSEDTAGAVAEWSDLVGAVDEAGAVLIVGDLDADTDAEAETHLIGAVRAGPQLGDRVSTVDNVVDAAGRLAVPFTLAEQLAGQTGHYGALGSATAFFPPVPSDEAS